MNRTLALLVLALLCVAPPVLAQTAESLNEQGKISYGRGAYAEALAAFQAAWDADPDPRYLLNTAKTLEKLDRLADAVDAWERHRAVAPDPAPAIQAIERLCPMAGRAFVTVTTSEPAPVTVGGAARPTPLCLPPGRHTLAASAGERTARLDVTAKAGARSEVLLVLEAPAPMGTLRVRSDVLPATVRVDERPAGVAPLALSVPAGIHTVEVSAEGRPPWTHTARVEAGEVLEVEAFTGGEPVAVVAEPFNWGWVTAGVGIASLVTAGVLYGVAYDRFKTADGLDPKEPGYSARFDDLIATGDELQIGSYVMAGVGVLMVVPTVLLWETGDPAPPTTAAGASMRWALTF